MQLNVNCCMQSELIKNYHFDCVNHGSHKHVSLSFRWHNAKDNGNLYIEKKMLNLFFFKFLFLHL